MSFFATPSRILANGTATGGNGVTTKTYSGESINSPEGMFNVGIITHPEIKKTKWINEGIGYFLTRAITVLAALAGSVAVAFMVWGGFMMILSAGNEDQYRKGMGYIKGAAIGLGFVFGAYILVTAVQLLIKGIYG